MSALVRINLLDWRSAARERKRQRFLLVLAAAAVASVVLAGVLPMLYYNNRIDAQQTRNAYLQSRIATADKQLVEIRELQQTRESLINRMRIIEQLQQSRSSIVHYFDQLVATLPDGVFLTSLTQNADTTTLNGVAESNARVSEYMVNLDISDWLTNPRLIVIKSSETGPRRYADFTLKVDSTNPQAPTTKDSDTAPVTSTGSRP